MKTKRIISIEEHTILISRFQRLISTESPNVRVLGSLILGGRRYDGNAGIFDQGLNYIVEQLKGSFRKLGQPAAIHPLSTVAILARSHPGKLDAPHAFLGLFHDLLEDIPGIKKRSFSKYFHLIDPEGAWDLDGALRCLSMTKKEKHRYWAYLGRIIDYCNKSGDLLPIHVKIADRMSNTLDTHLAVPTALTQKTNFYRDIFDVLLSVDFKKLNEMESFELSEAERIVLFRQILKNLLFCSLINSELKHMDETGKRLFTGLIAASIGELEWLGLEVMHKVRDVRRLREIIYQSIDYVRGGGMSVRAKSTEHPLDGILLEIYAERDRSRRKRKTLALYKDNEVMTAACVALVAAFSSFIHEKKFTIPGVSPTGLDPVS